MKHDTEKEKKETTGEWKAIALEYGTKAVREFAEGFAGKVRHHIEEAIAAAIRRVLTLLLALLGVLLVVVGLVQLINYTTETLWMGYFVVGGFLLVIGLLVSSFGARKR